MSVQCIINALFITLLTPAAFINIRSATGTLTMTMNPNNISHLTAPVALCFNAIIY